MAEFFIPTSLLLSMLVSEAYSHVNLSLWELDHFSCTVYGGMCVMCFSLLGVNQGVFLFQAATVTA